MNKKAKVIILLSIVFLLLSTATIVMAKYIQNNNSNTGIAAAEFYFTSDYLDIKQTDETFPEYTLGSGVDTIIFNLNNYVDTLQYTTVDISYKVTVTDSSDNVVKELTGTIEATGNINSSTVTIADLAPGVYVVTASSTVPYSKTLMGKFTIQGVDEGFSYTVSDAVGSPIVQVTISVADYQGLLNIKWPTGVTPDNGDPLLAGAVGCDNYSIMFAKFSEYTFIFFKTNSSDKFEKTDFVIIKD